LPNTTGWRIDDLAQRAQLTVDTIRYYQREGLLPPAERSGRLKLYGSEHLRRLDRIRELQQRRFSLAAIKALLDEAGPGLVEGLFDQGGAASYSRAELIERSGVEPEIVDAVESVGLLPDPKEFGRNAFDNDDVALLAAVGELQRLGMPVDLLVSLSAIYVKHFDAMLQEALAVLATGAGLEWEPEELIEFQTMITGVAGQVLPTIERVLNYVHHRTLQRLTLEQIRRTAESVAAAEAKSAGEAGAASA
jgi:DNA-binding transcriptional MerR regulator